MVIALTLVFVILGTVYLSLQRGDKPKIAPPTSPKGKPTRIANLSLAAVAVCLFIYNAIGGGFNTRNILLTLNVIIILAMVYLSAKHRRER